jgi:hypothetical protein
MPDDKLTQLADVTWQGLRALPKQRVRPLVDALGA